MFLLARALLISTGVLLATSAAEAVPASADSARFWRPFLSNTGRFEVSMPGIPVESSSSDFTPIGMIRGSRFWVDRGRHAFGVEVRDLPGLALHLLSPAAILEQAKDGILADSGGREITYREISFQGHPAREVVFSSEEDGLLERALLLLVGERLYIVAAAEPAEATTGSAERFLQSFDLWR